MPGYGFTFEEAQLRLIYRALKHYGPEIVAQGDKHQSDLWIQLRANVHRRLSKIDDSREEG